MFQRLCILFIASAIVLVGCQQDNQKDTSLSSEEGTNQYVQVKDSQPAKRKNVNNQDLAAHLSHVASKVPNVKDAAAVVAGPYSVVGIDVDKDLDRSRVGSIKYSVLEALRHDPYGKTAVVVADADVTERLRNISDKIGQGHPVQGVVDELSGIVGRYMPDFPISEDQPQEPDQNKEVIPRKDKKKLDDIQKDQSNHNK